MRRIVLTLAVLAVAGILAAPALAEHELGHNDTGQVAAEYELVLPAGYDASQVYVWGRGWGSSIGLYGFKALCYNDGGYWYWSGDGYYYWHAC